MVAPNRYEKEPRKRAAYINAFESISIYGMERQQWNYISFGLCRTEMKEIWAFALLDAQGNSRYDCICDYIPPKKRRRRNRRV